MEASNGEIVFGFELKKKAFLLDTNAVHFNHGSYGAVPRTVLNKQIR